MVKYSRRRKLYPTIRKRGGRQKEGKKNQSGITENTCKKGQQIFRILLESMKPIIYNKYKNASEDSEEAKIIKYVNDPKEHIVKILELIETKYIVPKKSNSRQEGGAEIALEIVSVGLFSLVLAAAVAFECTKGERKGNVGAEGPYYVNVNQNGARRLKNKTRK